MMGGPRLVRLASLVWICLSGEEGALHVAPLSSCGRACFRLMFVKCLLRSLVARREPNKNVNNWHESMTMCAH